MKRNLTDAERARLLYESLWREREAGKTRTPVMQEIQLLRRFDYTYETKSAVGLLTPDQLAAEGKLT